MKFVFYADRIKPFIEILKLKGSAVDVSVILATSAFVGEVDARIVPAIISGALMHSGSDIYNDIYDREIDGICKPEAPIPSGRMSVKVAWAYLSLLTFTALVVSLLLSKILFLCYVIGILCGYVLYSHPNFRFKDKSVVAIAIIAFCFVLESIGVWSIYSYITGNTFIVAAYIFLLIFSLVFMKDFRDVRGDVNSLPLMLGVRRAAKVCCGLAFAPVIILVILSIVYKSIYMLVTAVIFLFLIYPCVKILLFGDPVIQGDKLKDRMILSLSVPNIILFILTFRKKIAEGISL
ncbi:MAG: UbiA family prenyltransferase [Methanobacteriota archaeon]